MTFYRYIKLILCVLLLCRVRECLSTADQMKKVTMKFAEALEHCREESKLTKEMMEHFYHYWNDDFQFTQREFGCAIICMSQYFDLVTEDERIHHSNANDFLNSITNDARLTQKVIDNIHTCEQQFDHVQDSCLRVLSVSECFKKKIIADGTAPTVELMMVEFIMEKENN